MNRRRLAMSLTCAAAVMLMIAPCATAAPGERVDAATVRRGNLLAPKVFRAAAARIRPAIVTIETFGGLSTSQEGTRRPKQKRKKMGLSKPGEGPTSGLLISSDGYIVTSSYNFIRKPSIITVSLHDGSQYVAEMLGRDDTRKLCVLKIKTSRELPYATFVDRDALRVGQWAISVGVGYGGDDPSISVGIISATHRVFGKAVQTDANISPACYGGPLIDIRGRVIGICVPLSPRSTGLEAGVEWYDSGIGFAVPLDEAASLLERLKNGDHVRHGKMGVQLKQQGDHLVVQNVVKKSPAEKAGMKKGDVIVSVGGEPVTQMLEMSRLIMGRYIAGDSVEVVVKRGGEEHTFNVTLEAGLEQPMPSGRPRILRPKPGQQPDQPDGEEEPEPDEDRGDAPDGDSPDDPQPPDEPEDDAENND